MAAVFIYLKKGIGIVRIYVVISARQFVIVSVLPETTVNAPGGLMTNERMTTFVLIKTVPLLITTSV